MLRFQCYELEMRGQLLYWPDDWEVERSTRLIDCLFTRLNQEKNISIRTEVMADNKMQARELGYHICLAESDIFAFCSDTLILLDLTWIGVKEKTSVEKTCFSKINANMIIAPQVS
jgi:hypothetical protein